ncbi:MAG: hypothetical protein UY26_C0001G0085 [Candidatus Jorgensenbacteria bacterium GW2011_GWA1_48_13]|uniref:Uncharacterized protein n=2 Tax=Candidatus Joergenseniibacteriota TaxID=1752739 RepID=A0A0G1W951_9BACT|nr:MAG: hypothetical protein UY26_C0001G0085 [Candidatus Jorgensenbacteria bacterium GW2011_GWA1_48_13]KKU98836.1 MAG: hypothetical protein UY32_C0013G0033 [Candidatus Jorgensenbacteria bacterium GW2011_GWC1_48_8]KKW15331.1 MAG: hypothetical protein UY55_C0001G0085 [Candidatus Jorgensenbacteria bacterium GW2011_GWB1_50_10]
METKSENSLDILWTTRFIAWAKRVGGREEDLFDTGYLRWRFSSPEGTLWQATFDHIMRRAREEDITPEEFVKRLFGHGRAEEVLVYFRGS